MLWLGKKLFRFREKLTINRGLMAEDEEKPFLDHLEDLRQTLMRIIITLVVSMVVCFIFEDRLVDIVRYPVRAAKVGIPDEKTLPQSLTAEDWINTKKIARGLIELPTERHAAWLGSAASGERERLRPHAEALRHYHSALLLPVEAREGFLREALSGNQPALDSALEMLVKKPDARMDRSVVERGGDLINMVTLGVAEGFNTTIKLSLYAGIIVAFPVLLYFLLLFILPGLKNEEKKVLWPSLAVGFGLFLVGVSFAYFVVLPRALAFFYAYTRAHEWAADYRFSDYASFVTQVTFIFGLGFELPVVVYALIRLGLLSFSTMRRTRGYAVLIIAVVSAIVTPTPDAGTMLALTLPLIILYEICIWLAYFHERAEKKREAREEAERRARRERANLAGAYLPAPAAAADDLAAPSQEAAEPESADATHATPDAGSDVELPLNEASDPTASSVADDNGWNPNDSGDDGPRASDPTRERPD